MPPTPNSSAPLTKSGWRVGGSNSGGNASENSFPAPTGRLVLEDGTVFTGTGVGKIGAAVGEVCFNTAMTGYQEIISDPSYAGQIITFTFPHIGNVGINPNDLESAQPAARGVILRAPITDPSNYRASGPLSQWLADNNLVGICGIDTRRLTRYIRDNGAPKGAICHSPDGEFDLAELKSQAADWPGLAGLDLARSVTCADAYDWRETEWSQTSDSAASPGFGTLDTSAQPRHIVAVDFGAKRNILRCLAGLGARVTVVPATASAADIMALAPDGIFLSNGPGDPAATALYAKEMVQALITSGKPIFGICLGHQILALALGGKTRKMHMGHRGGNHPVQDISTGIVEITSQNHGFVVDADSLPAGVNATHISLFDGSLEGLSVAGKPIFSVQHHPEASPGPQDSHYLFTRFMEAIDSHA